MSQKRLTLAARAMQANEPLAKLKFHFCKNPRNHVSYDARAHIAQLDKKTSETLFGSMEKIGGAIPAQGMSTSIQTP